MTTNDFIKVLLTLILFICTIGIFLQLSYISYLLIKVLKDVRKITEKINTNVEMVEEKAHGLENIVYAGIYNIIKKIGK